MSLAEFKKIIFNLPCFSKVFPGLLGEGGCKTIKVKIKDAGLHVTSWIIQQPITFFS